MLEGRQSLDLAIELARMPALAVAMRERPLPPDTLVVIRIAAGCADTIREAQKTTGLKAARIREACVLYIQQILLAPDADSHRVLGVRLKSSREEMREHMRWLMRWLHPDTNREEWESVFAERVLSAWRDAGSRARKREADDEPATQPDTRGSRKRRSRRRPVQRWVALPLKSASQRTRKRRRVVVVAMSAVLIGALGLAVAFLPTFGAFKAQVLSATVGFLGSAQDTD